MSRMARRYQGVRAGQIINILKGREKNTQPEATISPNPDTRDQVTPETKTLSYDNGDYKTKQRFKITKSYSLSNLIKCKRFITQRRRCTSLPPTITVPYEKQNDLIIFSDVSLVDRGCSLSMSALTDDYTKEFGQKRCSSVPPSFSFNYEYTQIFESEPENLIEERKLKNREIHLPSDYITATKEARVHPFPYETIQINYDFVKDYNNKTNWRYSTIRPGRKAGEPVVVDLRVIQYRPDGTIHYKINFDDDWTELPVRPRKLNSVTYSALHFRPIPIASTKFNHLQQLKEVLPRDCHSFYDNLPHE